MTNIEAIKILQDTPIDVASTKQGILGLYAEALNMAIEALSVQPDVPDANVGDLISRNSVEHLIMTKTYDLGEPIQKRLMMHDVEQLPSAQSETCEGCKHLGKWENEVEYGYPSPCTRCKRRVEDNYER